MAYNSEQSSPNQGALVEKPVYIAGCFDCHGMSTRWMGKAAFRKAEEHEAETGHRIWTKEDTKVKAVPPPPKPKKKQPNPLANPSLPKERLSKRAMCDGKIRHHHPAGAQKAINLCDYPNKELLAVYQCLYCGKWHVGHIIKPWVKK